MTIKLSDINPKKNPAFSPNLYRWMRKGGVFMADSRVYEGPSGVEGHATRFIGIISDDHHDFCGSKLNSALCEGGRAMQAAYPWLTAKNLVEVVNFWPGYLKLGRCAIYPEHRWNFDGQWLEEDDVRTCQWCGLVQRRERYTYTEQRERWVEADAVPAAPKAWPPEEVEQQRVLVLDALKAKGLDGQVEVIGGVDGERRFFTYDRLALAVIDEVLRPIPHAWGWEWSMSGVERRNMEKQTEQERIDVQSGGLVSEGMARFEDAVRKAEELK